jgi:hypothetical protein
MFFISRKPNAHFLLSSWLPGLAQTLGDEILNSIGMLHVGNPARTFASSMRPK